MKFSLFYLVLAASGTFVAQAKPVAAPIVEVDSSAILASVLVERIKRGETTAEAAWESGELDEATLLYLLENTSEWGVLPGNGGEVLRRELGLLLPRHAPEKLEGAQLGSLPLEVRLWVGDALGNAVDVRAVTVLGSVLDEMKGRAKADNTVGHANTLAFLSIERLAWFYEVSNQPEKAAQTWAKIEEYYIGDVWVLPDALWQAGRFYGRSGHKDLAQEYLAKAESYHHPLFSSFVSYDQARALFAEGKPLDARALIQSKLVPPTEYMGRAIQTMMLAQSYYATGNFEQAQQLAQETLEGASKVGKVSPVFGFDVVGNTAQALLKWSKLWQETPFVCSPDQLTRNLRFPRKGLVWKAHIKVRSFKAVALSVSCDNAQVKCTLIEADSAPQSAFSSALFAEQTIEVEWPSDAAIQTTIHVTSNRFPQFQCRIPLKINS